MLSPKRQKYRKQFRGSWRRIAVKGNELAFGSMGIITLKKAWITDRQIESARVIMARATRKAGKYWIRIFPDKPYSKKPPEVTMGAGKGDVSHFVASVVPGRVLFEIDGLPEQTARKVFRDITSKLPVTTKFIKKEV